MKKTLFFAAIAAMFVMASCQKDSENEENQESKSLVFSAIIDNSITRTTINTTTSDETNRGKVSWEITDEITISDGTNSAVYSVQSIDANGRAIFTKQSDGADLATSGVTYTATYGSAPATTQTYSATAGKLPMSATSTTTNLTFTTTCGLLKLNLTALSTETDKTISKIEVIGTPTEGSETTYTLTCSSEQNIESAKDFYIALPAGTYTDMVFYNKTGFVCQKTSTGMTIAANDIQPVKMSSVAFNLLPGKFTVASGKQVRFSKGNLYWDGSAYHLEAAQNVTYATLGQSSYTATHVCHFYWTNLTDYQSGTPSYMPYASSYSYSTQSTDDKFFCGEDNPMTVDGQSGLYALSGGDNGEWKYLFETRTNASNLYKNDVSVTTSAGTVACCVVIAPDACLGEYTFDKTKTSYTAAEWAAAEAGGLVCLPAAGYWNASAFYEQGFYWSATPFNFYDHSAYTLHFSSGYFRPAYRLSRYDTGGESRYQGNSVRLVK